MMNSVYEAYGSLVSKMGSPSKSDSMQNKKVLCVGLCTLDIVQVVTKFPEEDSEQRCLDSWWQRGGNSSNNCTVLSQLGMNCEFLGTLSKDNHFTFLSEDFSKQNINTDHCIYHGDCKAPVSTVILSLENSSRTIIHSNASLPELKFNEFKALQMKNYFWIHFEGRNISEVVLMMEYVDHWNSTLSTDDEKDRIKISLDLEKPRTDLLDLLPYADIVFVGKDFARARKCTNMSETLKSVAKDTKEGATIICAWGDRGAMARTPDGRTVQSPAYPPRKVIDTLGAGDTFCATVIFSLANGRSLQESISVGCQVAGGKVGHRGFHEIGKIYDSICCRAES